MTDTRKNKPVVKLAHHTYQPSKAELEEDVSIDATPEEIARAVLRPVQVVFVEQDKPKKKGWFRRKKQ